MNPVCRCAAFCEQAGLNLKPITMYTRYLTYLPALALAWSITGCFLPFSVNNKPRTFGEIDDKIVIDMRHQGLSQSRPYYLNEINTRVLRNFMANYWNATNPQWVKYAEGFVVYFKSDSIQHRVYYDNTGGRQPSGSIQKRSSREIRIWLKAFL